VTTQLEATVIGILLYVLAGFFAYFFLSGFIWGAGFEPTRKKDIDTAAKLLGLREGMLVYDLGSGTGDVVIHLAKKYKVKCVGIEIDPLKAWISRVRISRSRKLRDLIEIKRGNFLNVDLSRAEVIYVFLSGGTHIMRKLEEKLSNEKQDSINLKIASYVHSFPDLKEEYASGEIRVYSVSDLKNSTK
jgi:SAM-dependent methyltransferase